MDNNGLEIDSKKFLKFCLSSKKKMMAIYDWKIAIWNTIYRFDLAILRYWAIHQTIKNVKWNRKESTSLNVKWV